MDIGSDRLPNGTNVAKARRLDMLTSRIKAAAASASNAQLNSEQQPTSSKVNCSICGVIGGVEDRWTSTGICPKCSQKQPPCGVCQNPVGKQQTHIRCFSCTSFVHVHCASTVSLQSPAQYVCPPCQQRSRMPMTPQQSAANPEELARIIQSGQINPVIHQALAQAFGPPDVILQQFGQFSKAASVRPFNESPQSSSDTLTLNDLDDTASLSQNVSRSAMSSPTTATTTTTASGSACASPAFANGDSLDAEDLKIPSTRRGKESSRGGRAGKKKPGAVGGRQSARTRNAGGKPASAIAYLSDKGSNPTGKGGKGGKARGRSQKGKGKSTPRTRKTRSVNDLSKILNRNDEGVENEDPKVRAADENDYIRTPIVTSAFDTYVKEAPLCLVCGSIGKDVEGTMLSCSTCAQSYHTYCVGMHDKMSTTILKRGWRCLDCTICEGCGDGKDESKLLLCDECDMAFHTYCLNPPLHSIPPGSWRCKWCTTCARCNCLVSSAYELQLSEGFCGPCYSQRKCPKCKKLYETGELMIRCQHCTRWLHGRCEDLSTEEALENASENAFRCSMCRPKADAMASTMLIDNVLLTKTALDEMSQRHGNHFLRSTSSMSFGAIVDSYHRSHSFDNDGFLDDGSIDDRADTDFVVSRGRGRGGMRGSRMPRLGVGGFIVKQPRHRMLAAQNMEEEEGDGDLQNGKSKIKRPRKPRKPPLEECYPPQIQESFFGMHPVDSRTLEAVEEPMLDMYLKTGLDKEINKTGCALSGEVAEQLANEDMMIDDADLMGLDMDIDMDFNLLMDEDDEALNQMLGDNDDLNDALDIAHSDPLFESTRPLQPMIDQHHQMAHGVPVGFHNPHGPQHLQLQMQRQQQQPAGAPNQRGYGVQKAKPDIEKGNQATERWQEDEPLGDKATKAAVLYANVTFPNLKNEYPEWSERQKQITRLWRALGQEERLKYVARARENRTNRTKMARPLKKASESTPITSNVLPSGMNPTAQSMVMQQMGGMRQPHQIKLEMPAQVPNVPTQAFKVPTVPSTPLDQGPSGFPIQMQQQQMRVMNQPGAAQFVPQSAGIPAAQQVHIPPNLPSELLEQYNLLQKRTTDLELQQSSIEDDLTKMRKLKKSLTAKRRQLQKSASSEGQGLDPSISSVDLNDTDLQQLDRLTDGIPIRQRALEECRKELRVHKSNVMEFEGKCGIQGIQRPTSSAPSPQHPFPSQSPAVAIKTEIDFSSGPPTPSSGRPGSSASFTAEMIFQQQNFALQQQQQVQQAQPTKRGRKRKPKIEEPPVAARPAQPMPTLGGISLLQLQTDEEIGAYFVLNDLVNKAVRMVDGSEPEDGIHKILQQATAGLGPGRGPMGLNFPSLQQMPVLGEPSKTKKKRTQQPKKPPGNISDGTDEYTMFVQRIETQLRLCPVIPPLLQNPSSKRSKGDQYMLQHMDLSTLPDKGPQKAVIGNEFGCISLNFVRDFYDDFENRRHRISSAFPSQVMLPYASTSAHPPSMSMVCREAHLGNLMHYPGGLSDGPILFYDENEGMDTYAEAGYNLIGLRPWSLMTSQGQYPQPPMVRAIHRFVDRQQPMPSFSDPGRIAMIESEISCFDDCPEVTVGITIHDGADVSKVVGCLKEILGNDVASYDVAFESPPMSPMIRTDSVVPEHMAMNGIAEEVRTQICRQCSTPMRDAAIQQSLNQMGIAANENTSDDKENTVSFCSMQCYYTFVADRKIPLTPEQVQDAEQYVDKPTLVKLQQVAAENFARCLNQGKLKSVDMSYGPRIVCPPHPSVASISNAGFNPLSPIIGDAPTSLGSVANVREMMLRVSDLPSLIDDHQRNPAAASRKPDQKPVWKGRGWTVCDFDLLESFTKSRKEAKCLCIADQIRANERNKIRVEADLRQCVLCSDIGDGEVDVCGRLLNFDADKWVHVNCALWSPEVAEINGGLQNVDEAIKRGQKLNCRLCGRPGATLVCAKQDCSQVNGHYHLKCAIRANGRFVRDKTFFCNEHEVREDQRVYALSALRRIYIEKDENRLIAKLFQSGATPNASTSGLLMRVGSLIFSRIGQLLPEQLKNFHSQANIFPSDLSGERRQAIYPSGYTVSRLFWSADALNSRVRYDCTIVDIGRQPQFQISFSRKVYKDVTATQAWMPILTSVKRMRDENGEVLKMFPSQMSGEELFGLNEPVISKLTESLPGVDQLLTYNFKHSGSPLMDLPLAENPSGCARCEPYFRTFVKQKKTRWQITPQKSRPAHNFAAPASSSACVDLMATSSSRETRARHASSVNAVLLNCDQTIVRQLRASGMSDEAIASAIGGQTTTANFSQYKKMTKEWRNNVYLARSKIQGLGLYAKRDIDMNSMVIEYIGEIIRSEVGEVREKRYIAQNRGVYMFRIDEQTLVDATMTGGLARYINHSCDPNCSTKVVTYSDEKHIIIYANRPIKADEELTYDYLFEEEEHSEKIACLCGAPNCAKFMN